MSRDMEGSGVDLECADGTSELQLVDVGNFQCEIVSGLPYDHVVTIEDGPSWTTLAPQINLCGEVQLEEVVVTESPVGSSIHCIVDDLNVDSTAQTLREDIHPVQQISIKAKKHHCVHVGCEKSYATSHLLKLHERAHTGVKPYACTFPSCDKRFVTDYSRKTHERTHTGEKPFPCPAEDCGKSFKTRGDLQKHIRTHTGERPFMCPFEGCNKSFTTSDTCKLHIRTHTGEKPYECTYEGCLKRFASPSNFKNHLRIHTGTKPFSCYYKDCLKSFTEHSSLYKHLMVHSQGKQYQCPFCVKAYRQMSTLTTHKRIAHGVVSNGGGVEVSLEEVLGLEKNGNSEFKALTSNLINLQRVTSITYSLPLLETSLRENDLNENGETRPVNV